MSPYSTPGSRYFQSPTATISYGFGDDFLYVHWSALPATPAELQAVYEQAMRGFRLYGVHKLLSNHSQRPPLPALIGNWLAQEWIPQAVREVGYSHCAIVDNSAPLGRLAARAVGAQLPSGLIQVRHFDEPTAAADWLRAQP